MDDLTATWSAAQLVTHLAVPAYRFAADNLSLGSTVVANSVNPIEITRDAWWSVGDTAGVPVIEIYIICSDQEEHKQRVETRIGNLDGLVQPTWEEVLTRNYEPWTQVQLVVDTVGESPEQSCKKILSLTLMESSKKYRYGSKAILPNV